MTSAITRITQRFGKWRLVLGIFLLVYVALLLIELDSSTIQWDETPHLHGGFLLNRGQFQEYVETESFYPPAYDLVTGLFFKILGPSAFSARLVAVIFGILCVWAVFEIGNQMYGPRTGLVAGILLASMPGFVWLSRMAMLETMLMFFFSVSLLLFFQWIRKKKAKMLILAGLTLGVGFLVKYQALVGGLVMLAVLLVLGKQKIQNKLGSILMIGIITLLIALPWFLVTYQAFSGEILETWFYSAQLGNESRLAYSTRLPWPIFYFIEMVWPYSVFHPISVFVYLLTLMGIGFLLKRRNQQDQFLVLSFFVVYSFFTLITSKDWRYITLVFPILAIAGSGFIISVYDKVKERINAPHLNISQKKHSKIIATVFVLLISSSVVFGAYESYVWLESQHFSYPVEEACKYVSENSMINESAVAFFTTNFFSFGLMRFYLELYDDSSQRMLLHYPENPVDVYEALPNDERFYFSINKLMRRFDQMNVKYLLLIEWEEKYYFKKYYDSSDVMENLNSTNRFMLETSFGTEPHRMFIIRYLPNS